MENFANPFATCCLAIIILCLRNILRTKPGEKGPQGHPSHGILALILALLLSISISIGSTKGTTNSPPLTFFCNPPPMSVPTWYLDRSYRTTDSDGDGIPDKWEKWTRTDPRVNDATLDPDGDGVDNLEEFTYQCDPMRADTDGDHLGDRVEIDGMLAGGDDMDPLVPATYEVSEPDEDGDGFPDIWGNSHAYFSPRDWNGNGYCDEMESRYADITNGVDAVITVSSSRSCVLEATGMDYGILLPVCTNLEIRIRVSADGDTRLRLLGAPDGTAIASTWKARLQAAWATDQGCETENDRIRTSDGAILDISDTQVDFAGPLIGTAPMARGLLGAPAQAVSGSNSAIVYFRRRTISLSGTPFCSIHGPAPTITATRTRVDLPLHWEVTGTSVSEDGGDTFTPNGIIGWTGDYVEVVCSKRDGHSRVVLEAKVRYNPAHCRPCMTNIVGACWSSTHDPNDASDHEPGIEETHERYAANCPVTTNVTVTAGYTHNQQVLHIRNLIRIPTGNAEDDETDHCIGVIWESGMSICLWDFVDSTCCCVTNQMSIRIATAQYEYVPRKKPTRGSPIQYNVRLCNLDGSITYDRMWLVVCSPSDKDSFESWYSDNVYDMSWIDHLPLPTPTIVSSTNYWGAVSAEMSPTSMNWSSGKNVKGHTYMHHNAYFEFRTQTLDQEGNQATYDISGNLITETIAAGTSDKFAPYDFYGVPNPSPNHREKDVKPFLAALQLDGNPGLPLPHFEMPLSISRPCLYQGEHLEKYLNCRPIVY